MLLVLLGAFGTLGVGAGFALGAKLCRPDAEVSQSLEAGGLLCFWAMNNPNYVPSHLRSGACLGMELLGTASSNLTPLSDTR